MQYVLTIGVLFGWVPLTILLFAALPPRRALLIGLVAGWVALPTTSVDLPGLPAFSKDTSICIGVLAGALLFAPRSFLALRPRWFDLPIVLYCLAAFATSISNNLGAYDGVSAAFSQMRVWLLPYLIGRAYFTEVGHLRDLEVAVVVSMIFLAPLCLIEMRIGSQLQRLIYGTGGWEGARDGFYRPAVFFQSGLVLGMWMYLGCLSSWWLRRARQFTSLGGTSVGMLLPPLVVLSVLCRATGATLLAMTGAGLLWFSTQARTRLAAWGLIALVPIYCTARINGAWTGERLVDAARTYFSEERARSLAARTFEEDHLIARAMQRPMLGWGRFNRIRVISDASFGHEAKLLHIVDSMWSITLGTQGVIGLVLLETAMLLPSALFFARVPPRRWGGPEHAAAAVLAVFLVLYALDCLANAMPNPLYTIVLGGVANIAMARPRPRGAHRAAPETVLQETATRHRPATAARAVVGPRERLAARYQELGRGARAGGRLAEARDAWSHALELWRDPRTGRVEGAAARARWLECSNDLAWLLAEAADPAVKAPDRAVALALETVAAGPEQASHWNTLGAAHYRAGDFPAAIAALERSVELGNGGGPFDHLFLAMANAQTGHEELARLWAEQAADALGPDQPGSPELRRLREEAEAVLSSGPSGAARRLEAP